LKRKDYALTEETMRKTGDLGFLSVAVPEAYGVGNGLCVLVCDYLWSNGIILDRFGAHTEWYNANRTLYTVLKNKSKNTYPKLASGEWFGAYCLTEPVL
jgi:alkylation response protein AidB-like acyl-CoA dehydrogenase